MEHHKQLMASNNIAFGGLKDWTVQKGYLSEKNLIWVLGGLVKQSFSETLMAFNNQHVYGPKTELFGSDMAIVVFKSWLLILNYTPLSLSHSKI